MKEKKDLLDDYPTTAILDFLNLVLRNNMFISRDTYYLQIKGNSNGNKLSDVVHTFCDRILRKTHTDS